MSNSNVKTRLFVEEPLGAGAEIRLEGTAGHHLVNVMRCGEGEYVALFNGRDGEWRSEIIKVGKGRAVVIVRENIAEQQDAPDLWYLFAPLKKARTDYMMEKATELGVSLIRPVMTERTNLMKLKQEKLHSHVIQAAEQCGRLTVPQVDEICSLRDLLAGWPDDRLIMFCDEGGAGLSVEAAAREVGAWQDRPRKWAILIGPEGGFTSEERALIRQQAGVVPISLGPLILRADTAAVAALSLWHSFFGDWMGGENFVR